MASSYAKQADDMASKQESVHQQESAASAYEDSVPVSSTALERRSAIEKALPAELVRKIVSYMPLNGKILVSKNNRLIRNLIARDMEHDVRVPKYVDFIHDPSFSITQFKADLKRLGIDTEDKELLIHYIGAVYFLNRDASASTEGVTVKVTRDIIDVNTKGVKITLKKNNRSVDTEFKDGIFTSFKFQEDEKFHTDNDSPAMWTSSVKDHKYKTFSWYRNGKRHRKGDKPAYINYIGEVITSISYYMEGVEFRGDGKPMAYYHYLNGLISEIFPHKDHAGQDIIGSLYRRDYFNNEITIYKCIGNNRHTITTRRLDGKYWLL